jgi:hypothetical protein
MDNERIYTRKVWNGRTFKQRSVKESELTDDDYIHYYAKIAEAYNAAPVGVKQKFLADAVPKMTEFMQKVKEEGIVEANDSLTIAKGLGGDTETVN